MRETGLIFKAPVPCKERTCDLPQCASLAQPGTVLSPALGPGSGRPRPRCEEEETRGGSPGVPHSCPMGPCFGYTCHLMNKEANSVQLCPNLAAAAVSISAAGPADGARGRQLLARQQELQMAARLCARFATVRARTNEEKLPGAFPIFLEVVAELPWSGRRSRSEEGQTQYLRLLHL